MIKFKLKQDVGEKSKQQTVSRFITALVILQDIMTTFLKWLCNSNKNNAISLTQTTRNINIIIRSEEDLVKTLLPEIKFVKDLLLEIKKQKTAKEKKSSLNQTQRPILKVS